LADAGYYEQDSFFASWGFCVPRHVSTLYPLRYDIPPAIRDDSVDVQDLAGLCEEVRHSLQAAVLPHWEHLTTLIPLIEERLLCCTGDPELRLDACWDRRARGTFLDFGWTRAKPDMPQQWSFFEYCKPETLMSILIEIIETVNATRTNMTEEWSFEDKNQAWFQVTLGSVLERCYERRILIQPLPDEISNYTQHMLYILAAIELTNTCFKSSQVNPEVNVFSISTLRCKTVEDLLRTPLRKISVALLCHPRRRSRSRDSLDLKSDVFPPSHLQVHVLKNIGSLKVDWTEYMHEHLKFDPETMTVYVFWFFSHIFGNASWQ
jgi:hypothetical protein